MPPPRLLSAVPLSPPGSETEAAESAPPTPPARPRPRMRTLGGVPGARSLPSLSRTRRLFAPLEQLSTRISGALVQNCRGFCSSAASRMRRGRRQGTTAGVGRAHERLDDPSGKGMSSCVAQGHAGALLLLLASCVTPARPWHAMHGVNFTGQNRPMDARGHASCRLGIPRPSGTPSTVALGCSGCCT